MLARQPSGRRTSASGRGPVDPGTRPDRPGGRRGGPARSPARTAVRSNRPVRSTQTGPALTITSVTSARPAGDRADRGPGRRRTGWRHRGRLRNPISAIGRLPPIAGGSARGKLDGRQPNAASRAGQGSPVGAAQRGLAWRTEVSGHLVGSPAFKAGGTGDPRPAGSIPVHLRHPRASARVPGGASRRSPGCGSHGRELRSGAPPAARTC